MTILWGWYIKTKATPLCLGKVSGFNGYVYDFSVDYDSTVVDDILDTYKYFMRKSGMGVKQ